MVESVSDKHSHERIIENGKKTNEGYVSDEGFLSFETLTELKFIQAAVKRKLAIEVSLKEAEYFWTSYCQEIEYASWVSVPSNLDVDHIEFARMYFEL